MGHDQRFVFESVQDALSIRKYLEAVMEGLGKGRLVVATGAEEFVLEPSGLLNFTVKARRRSGEGRLSLAISWKCPDEEAPKTAETLSIKA